MSRLFLACFAILLLGELVCFKQPTGPLGSLGPLSLLNQIFEKGGKEGYEKELRQQLVTKGSFLNPMIGGSCQFSQRMRNDPVFFSNWQNRQFEALLKGYDRSVIVWSVVALATPFLAVFAHQVVSRLGDY